VILVTHAASLITHAAAWKLLALILDMVLAGALPPHEVKGRSSTALAPGQLCNGHDETYQVHCPSIVDAMYV
jgi:hypothetical protein